MRKFKNAVNLVKISNQLGSQLNVSNGLQSTQELARTTTDANVIRMTDEDMFQTFDSVQRQIEPSVIETVQDQQDTPEKQASKGEESRVSVSMKH